MDEPINMLNPIHLNRAARGMHERLCAALPQIERINLVENVLQFICNGATIQVVADSFWAQPNVIHWFVTVNHANGNFQNCEGTPNADRALLDIGMAMEFAARYGDPIPDEH